VGGRVSPQAYDWPEHRRDPLAAARVTVTTRFFRTSKFAEFPICLAALELNAGGSGGLLDDKTAAGTEVESRCIQNQRVTGRQHCKAPLDLDKAGFLAPVAGDQSDPGRNQNRQEPLHDSGGVRLRMKVFKPSEAP